MAGELEDSQGHLAEQLKTMRDVIERLVVAAISKWARRLRPERPLSPSRPLGEKCRLKLGIAQR
jgi:hypothetical protein